MLDFGISTESFLKDYHGRQPKLFKNAIKENNISWKYINEMIHRNDIDQNYFQLSYNGIVDKSEYVESYYELGILKHRFIRPTLYGYLRNGATLTANRIVNEPVVGDYAKQISTFTGFPTICSAYIAFGEKSSFKPHWDSRDIFVLQTIGKKRWIIYPPSFENPLYMHKSLHLGDQYPCPKEPIMDIVLEEGDVLYLTRGYWHDPMPLGMETVHLTIAVYPQTGLEYVEWLLGKFSYAEGARKSLLSWESDEIIINKLANHVADIIKDKVNYNEFMQEFIGNQRVETKLNLELLGNDKVTTLPDGARLRLNSNQHYDEDSDFVIANGIKLTLDSKLKPVLLYIANHPNTTLDDILNMFNMLDRDEIKKTLYQLCLNDVLEIVSY